MVCSSICVVDMMEYMACVRSTMLCSIGTVNIFTWHVLISLVCMFTSPGVSPPLIYNSLKQTSLAILD